MEPCLCANQSGGCLPHKLGCTHSAQSSVGVPIKKKLCLTKTEYSDSSLLLYRMQPVLQVCDILITPGEPSVILRMGFPYSTVRLPQHTIHLASCESACFMV